MAESYTSTCFAVYYRNLKNVTTDIICNERWQERSCIDGDESGEDSNKGAILMLIMGIKMKIRDIGKRPAVALLRESDTRPTILDIVAVETVKPL